MSAVLSLTREQAEASLAAIVAQFRTYVEPMTFPAVGDSPALTLGPTCPLPTLLENFDGTPWVVVWEEGPDEWAYRATGGGTSEEDRVLAAEFGATLPDESPTTFPDGVWAEPVFSFALGLYPA